MGQAVLPTTIHIDTGNKDAIMTQEFSALKLSAIAEFEEMTPKGKRTIEYAVQTAKDHVIGNL